MIRNYVLIAFRNFLRQKGFSLINIIGLGTGMACSILILLWVNNEISYNRFNSKFDQLYLLVQTQHYVSGPLTTPCMPGPVTRDLLAEIPEIRDGFMFYQTESVVSHGNNIFKENVRLADPSLWKMFTFSFIKGDENHVFDDVNSVVVTDKLARKYFGDDDPIGKVLKINNEHLFKVTGVIEEVPENSSFRFDLCIPFEYIKKLGYNIDRYGWNSYFSYVELAAGADPARVNAKIKDFLMVKSADPDQKVDDPSKSVIDLFLFPLKDIHLHSLEGKGGDIRYVQLFSLVAVLILIIACINFMNLSTARAARRSREIGLRKTAGASKRQIILQFIGESLLITLMAFILAIVLVYIFLPGFNVLASKNLSLHWTNIRLVSGLIGIILFVGILAGSYPAFYLSSLMPVDALKMVAYKAHGSVNFRRILVVFQFTLSVALIICTIVVYRQLSYVQRTDTGMERENVIYTEMRGKTSDSYEVLKTRFLQDPSIESVSRGGSLPFRIGSNSGGFDWEGKDTKDEVLIGFSFTDVDYDKALGMRMKSGRYFDAGYSTDTASAVIINETAANVMGMDDPVGKWITWGDQRYTIIGVIDDFHFLPMTMEIGPLALFNAPKYCNTVFIKVRGQNTGQTIRYMQDTWERINPGFPFEYKFLDASYHELYLSEDRLGSIFKYFSILTILISCLGLFGLAAFIAEQRTKEIGVRKVLGSSVWGIFVLLSKNFLQWVIVANLIAWPVTFYLMSRWLDGYYYHTQLSPWIFLFAGLLSLVIALITVSFQTIRAATRNPVGALKYE